MKNIIYVVFATIVLASCQKPNKIGFVNNSEVINEYQGKKDVETKFQAKSDAFHKRRDSMVNAYQLELKDAQIKAQRMSQANLQKLSQEIQQKEQLLGQKIQLEQKQIQDAYQTEMDTLIIKVKEFVKGYGKANGYTYILGTSEAAASVLYGAEENDLTQTVLDALNVEYKKE